MQIVGLATVALLAAIPAPSAEIGSIVERKVVVCIETKGANDVATYQARLLASKMFARIGVAVDFRFRPRSCPQGALQIRFTTETPRHFIPGALAYALPYEGVHIQVFYDRIRDAVPPPVVPYLLAHVLVHEIAHILEGASRHSASGVMKAHWDGADYARMQQQPLGFTDEDIHLIHLGLTVQVTSADGARNAEGAAVAAQ